VRLEGLGQLKNPMASSGITPALTKFTFVFSSSAVLPYIGQCFYLEIFLLLLYTNNFNTPEYEITKLYSEHIMGTKIAIPDISLNTQSFHLERWLFKVRRTLKTVLQRAYSPSSEPRNSFL
jgi:hypothetical protein